jgi:hypothetical protein
MNFKQWLTEDMGQIQNTVKTASNNPTGDKKALTGIVHTAMQNPQVQNLATQMTGNNTPAVRKQVVGIAQQTLNNNPITKNNANPTAVTSVDVANSMLGQFGMKPITPPQGVGMGKMQGLQ